MRRARSTLGPLSNIQPTVSVLPPSSVLKKRPALRYSDSAWSVIERTSFSKRAEPFGLASSSRAISEPSAPRMPLALTS